MATVIRWRRRPQPVLEEGAEDRIRVPPLAAFGGLWHWQCRLQGPRAGEACHRARRHVCQQRFGRTLEG